MKLPLIPEPEWDAYFRELLQRVDEDILVISPAIGHVAGRDFHFCVLDDRIIRQRLLPYEARESKWLRTYVEWQAKMGVYCRVEPRKPDPTWIVNLILVPQGQSGQDYGACMNLPACNTRTADPPALLPNSRTILDELQGSSVFSGIDVKAGFHNVMVAPHLHRFCGIVTPTGVYIYQKMAFGYKEAPQNFQWIMVQIVGDRAAPFIDDVSIRGKSVHENWYDILDVFVRLTQAGLPVSWRKCQLLVAYLSALGVLVYVDRCQLGVKAIRKLFAPELPTSLRELQQLISHWALELCRVVLPRFLPVGQASPVTPAQGWRGGLVS